MKGYKVTREIFASLPAVDNRLADMSQKERDEYIKLLYENTKKVLAVKMLLPIKEHNVQGSEELHGSILDIGLKRKKTPIPHYVIMGDLFIDEEYYSLYKDKKLPGASVEIDPEGANLMAYTGNEHRVGEYIYAVSLLGKSPAAMPFLEMGEMKEAQPYNLYSRLLGDTRYDNNTNAKKEPEEESPMEEKMEKFMEVMRGALKELVASDSEESVEDPEMNEKPDPKKDPGKKKEEEMENVDDTDDYKKDDKAQDDKNTELEKKVEALEEEAIASAFSALGGKVNAENKKNFFKVARTQGVVFAKELFSSMSTAPPGGEIITDGEGKNVEGKEEKAEKKKAFAMYAKMNVKKEHWEETYTRMKERREEREAKQAS